MTVVVGSGACRAPGRHRWVAAPAGVLALQSGAWWTVRPAAGWTMPGGGWTAAVAHLLWSAGDHRVAVATRCPHAPRQRSRCARKHVDRPRDVTPPAPRRRTARHRGDAVGPVLV